MTEEERDIGAELRAATDLLKAVVRDRSLLGALTEKERAELVAAAADVFNPDIVQRRLWGKALRRNEKATRRERQSSVLAETGIRVLREKPVFTTPNVLPPAAQFEQQDVDEDGFRELIEPRHCY